MVGAVPTSVRGLEHQGAVDSSLSAADFAEIGRTVGDVAGIRLGPGKEGLVRSRLSRRMRALGVDTFAEYVARVRNDASGRERAEMIDLLTTNKTDFFREPAHFDVLREMVVPAFADVAGGLRVWSAGCATGEEAYTLAMVLVAAGRGGGTAERRATELHLPNAPGLNARVLATDISRRALDAAVRGVYPAARLADVGPALMREHMTPVGDEAWSVTPTLRALVRFARLNLMDEWPMRGPFHAIFCRNVMIYFDKPTQQRLVARFHALLAPGGYLFVGHAESLSAVAHEFAYVRPAVYRK